MTDTLSDKLRQMVARNDDELDALWEAADRIEELETALRLYACDGECANCYGPVQETKYCGRVARAALGDDKPFEDRWDNA